MLASFVILYHPTRLDNLNQCIRFLKKREKNLIEEEFIFVCQTNYNLKKFFKNQINLNLNLKNYHKSFMTNFAVNKSSGKFLILLDSDRILPKNYFFNSIMQSSINSVLSTENLYQLDKTYSDEEIEFKKIKKIPDFRKKNAEGRFKNLFAGNTVISKKAYEKIGGYDESFIGYGFADNDMSRKALNNNLNIIWLSHEELHLFHEKNICWNEKIINQETFKIITAINSLNYYKKWNLKIDKNVKVLLNIIENNIKEFPFELQELYKKAKSNFSKLFL